jgi:uncharacterized membrane protein YccC
MRSWLLKNQSKLQFGLRMTLAALISYALGEALNLGQTYWAVLSAVIVIQGSVGGSLTAGISRLVGTVGGAIWGAVITVLMPHGSVQETGAALLAAIAPLAVATAFRPDFRIAPATAIIVLMGTGITQADPVSSAISRVYEISLGSVVAVAVALLVLPARAHRLLALSASVSVAEMAELVSILKDAAGSAIDMDALNGLQAQLRAQIAQTEARAGEAEVERANHLTQGPDPEPVARNLRRLRHDIAMLVRALDKPLSSPARDRVERQLTAVFSALAAWLNAISQALASGEGPPAMDEVSAAMEGYKAAVSGDGQAVLTYQSNTNDTQRVYALLFIFEQMLQNLQDLNSRTAELAGQAQARAS